MSSTYTGVPANVTLGPAAQITEPSDGDARNASSANTALSKLTDYIAALMAAAPTSAFSESFDGATFPPTTNPGWATPSPHFGSDLSWVRSTTNPIAGTASASAPVPQGTTTNSSLGLTITLASPARVSFLFAVNCNANNSDHLDFYVDGVLTAQLSTLVSNTIVGSRIITDLLREGPHTFDWRFVRGGSASVGAEECKIDTVEIIPEEAWRGDPTRIAVFDEGFGPGTTTIAGANFTNGSWGFNTGANVGSYQGSAGTAAALGALKLFTAATAAGDWANAVLQSSATIQPATQLAFTEFRVNIPTLSANEIVEMAWHESTVAPAGNNLVGWVWDGSIGVGSTWRWRCIVGGVTTTVDSNIAIAANAWFRLGYTVATVRGVTCAVFMKDGKALPGAASVPPIVNAPTANTMQAGWRVRSVTAAFAAAAIIDWMRLLMLRQ